MTRNARLPAVTEQSFNEAGGRTLFGKLKMLTVICANNKEGYKEAINSLREQAKIDCRKVDYIFDVKYEGKETGLIKGTAYRKSPWYPSKNFSW